jgi:hypothetical protein
MAMTRKYRILMFKWLRSFSFRTEQEREFILSNLGEPDAPFEDWEEIKLFRLWAGRMIHRHNGLLDILMVQDWRRFCMDRDRVAEGEELLAILPDRRGILKRSA